MTKGDGKLSRLHFNHLPELCAFGVLPLFVESGFKKEMEIQPKSYPHHLN